MHKHVARFPQHLPDGTFIRRGHELSDEQVAQLDNDNHRHKLSSHFSKRVHEAAPEPPRRGRANVAPDAAPEEG